jgi:hypothetical protein
MDLEVLCKLVGVIFFIVMCWYFVFIVFKTNTEFLKSVVSSSNSDMEGFTSMREGFEGDKLTALENKLVLWEEMVVQHKKMLQLDDDGKPEKLELLKNILKNQIEFYEMGIILGIATDDKVHKKERRKETVSIRAFVDVMKEALENFEKYEGDS